MEFMKYRGNEYVHLQTLADSLGVCTATVRNWEKAGHLTFAKPLGPTLTFVTRETAERLMRLRLTEAMKEFARNMER